MNALEDSDVDELLFELPLAQSPSSQPHLSNSQSQDPSDQPWDGPDYPSDDDILEEYVGDSQQSLFPEFEEECESGTALHAIVPNRKWVVERIEDMLEKMVDGLLEGHEQLSISLKTRSGLSRRQLNPSQNTNTAPPPRNMELSYPGNNPRDARRFTIVVRILELIHSCLIDGTTMTKRDMYYRHPDLFGKQTIVDRYVDDIACTLGVSRSLLNVTAAAKGLMAGNFAIRRADGSSVHGLSEPEGIMVASTHDTDTIDLSRVHWILVIEKEATFRALLSSSQWKVLGIQGLVLTAKGFPDLVSRKFLGRLANDFPHIPMFALVDLDPDGIHIMSTYKYGSFRLAHEDASNADTHGINLPNLQWLGVQSHHINREPGSEGDTTTAALADVQGVMKLTARDRKKALDMLGWDVCGEYGPEPAWRAELQRMLLLNVKAEMQILDELPGGLVSWASTQLGVLQSGSADDDILF